ncbi:hypothetical protein [Microtetraspora malaysiensis]|uniref:hypothetical protein n=1 Tax=Microtetraspora malaysiensis TaxID=161358 RepID=UPI003D8E00AE
MITYLDRDLPWRGFTIPESAPDVSLAALHTGPAGSFLVLVRFPPGWARPGRGHYACDEEFVVIQGEIEISRTVFRAGARGWFPAGRERSDCRSSGGALALAWFSGPAVWVTGG